MFVGQHGRCVAILLSCLESLRQPLLHFCARQVAVTLCEEGRHGETGEEVGQRVVELVHEEVTVL